MRLDGVCLKNDKRAMRNDKWQPTNVEREAANDERQTLSGKRYTFLHFFDNLSVGESYLLPRKLPEYAVTVLCKSPKHLANNATLG
jgi:hypothetical protein